MSAMGVYDVAFDAADRPNAWASATTWQSFRAVRSPVSLSFARYGYPMGANSGGEEDLRGN